MELDPIDNQKAATKEETKNGSKHGDTTKTRKKHRPWAKKSKSKSASSTTNLPTLTSTSGVKKQQPRSQKKLMGLADYVCNSVEGEKEYRTPVGEEYKGVDGVRGKKRKAERTDWSRGALKSELAGLYEEQREYSERLGRKEDTEMENERKRPRRRVAVQNLGMKSQVDDIAARMGELGMGELSMEELGTGRKHEQH
jgi:hypothetical protein